ncbi:elongation of very long chain fatty acids protein 4-like [Adelges cooleyi]|uniref:elongation of very long chain fatty acids protein 4-like n=1 Tax=Adelges cooleyi TaxID=133065 RepID=UPI00218027F3|nr:elongation of very long chain fatty acids protein 4-like [Adelges cooleyi]XP_050440914.1 elongation of very long chain fatty acids protein 4-like [Adelges cooleyi]
MTNVTQESFNFLTETQNKLLDLVKNELVFDEVVDSWMFMSTPWPVLSTLVIYLLFVLKLGPKIMENRKPFNIKYVILLYNLIQTVYNGYLVLWFFITPGAVTYHFSHLCHPLPRNLNQYLIHELNKGSWFFFLSKVIDLLDTIFFVLRKKQSQVSFLHVYHHVNMVITCWAYLRFIKGEQLIFGGIINSFIHTVMYSYYFLSALGPQMQKYLWWKKYLTRMQIIQFLMIMVYEAGLYMFNCNFPRLFMLYIIADLTLFLYLFLMFYKKTYDIRQKPKQHVQ